MPLDWQKPTVCTLTLAFFFSFLVIWKTPITCFIHRLKRELKMMVLPKKGAQRRDSGKWRRRNTGTVNHNKGKMCLDLTVCFLIFSRVTEIFLQWHQAFAACGLPKIDPEYPGAHLQWESVSDAWQLSLEICSVSHTAHSAVGLTGLKMTFSLPFNPLISFGNYLGIHLHILSQSLLSL